MFYTIDFPLSIVALSLFHSVDYRSCNCICQFMAVVLILILTLLLLLPYSQCPSLDNKLYEYLTYRKPNVHPDFTLIAYKILDK